MGVLLVADVPFQCTKFQILPFYIPFFFHVTILLTPSYWPIPHNDTTLGGSNDFSSSRVTIYNRKPSAPKHSAFLINHRKLLIELIIDDNIIVHVLLKYVGLVWFVVFNATFNNISVISWLSVLLVEETGVPGENHRHVTSHWQTLSHIVVSNRMHLSLSGIQTHNVSLNIVLYYNKSPVMVLFKTIVKLRVNFWWILI